MPESNQVRVTGRYALQCAHETSLRPLGSHFHLGPFDHLVWPYLPVECVFVYRKPADEHVSSITSSEFFPSELLRQAASHLLDYYPHLTGRLQWNTDINAWGVGKLGTGAEFLEAQYPDRLDNLIPPTRSPRRLLLTDLPGSGKSLAPPFDRSIEAISVNPILAIQKTQFACGGVVLAIRIHHIVCDANGFFQVARNFAELYRQLRSSNCPLLTKTPQIRSYLLEIDQLSPEEQQAALQYQPSIVRLVDPAEEEPQAVVSTPLPTVGRALRFSGERLAQLKASATNPDGSTWVSTLEALSALLLQRVYQAKVEMLLSQGVTPVEIPDLLKRSFWGAMDTREPGRLALPPNYFPNAVYPAQDVFSHDLLVKGPLWKVAEAVHRVFRTVGPEKMENTARWIVAQPDKSRVKQVYGLGAGGFIVTQWTKTHMYEGVHFECGGRGEPLHPFLVSAPFTDTYLEDNLAVVMSTGEELEIETENTGAAAPSPSRGPDLVVNFALSQPVWRLLDKDPNFPQVE